MTNDRYAEYEIRLRDLFSSKLDAIERKMNQFENKVNNTGNIAAGVFGGITLANAARKAVDLIEDVSEKVVELGTNMEKTRISFETLFQRGKDFSDFMISKFQRFAMETPFSTKDVLEGARMLTAYRYEAEEIIPVMKQIGDITAGLNLSFKDVIWLVGHTKSIGYMDRRILREFTLRGIGIDEYIEKTKGISHHEFEQQIKRREITYKDIAKALEAMTSKGGQFYNLSEKLSLSVAGRWERFKDTLEIIATRMGEKLLPMLSTWLDDAFEMINKFKDVDMGGLIAGFTSLERAAKSLVDTLGDFFSSPLIKDFISALGLVFRATMFNIEQVLNRVMYAIDVANEMTQYGPLEGARHKTLKQQQLDKNFEERTKQFIADEMELSAEKPQYGLLGYLAKYSLDRVNKKNMGRRLFGGGHQGDAEDQDQQIGLEKISSATRHITVNITKLIETVNFTKSYEQDESKLRDMITRALVAEVNNVNLAVN